MSIVTTSDFVGDLSIAQIEQANIAANVEDFIVKYEAEYLLKVLGYTLLTAYNAGITAANADYIKVRDGGTYVDFYGDTVKYPGMKAAIANYIYYYYSVNDSTFTTGSGEQTLQKATAASSLDKQVRAWNRMVNVNKSLRAFLQANTVYGFVSYNYNEMFVYQNTLGL